MVENNKKRYNEYYSINFTKEENYDIILDTTNLSSKKTLNEIIMQKEIINLR